MKRWRAALWVLLLLLPGGLWVLGALALVKAVRRALHPEVRGALLPTGTSEEGSRLDPTASTSF